MCPFKNKIKCCISIVTSYILFPGDNETKTDKMLQAKPVSRRPHLSIWAAKFGLQRIVNNALIAGMDCGDGRHWKHSEHRDTNVKFFFSLMICMRSVLALCEERHV